MSRPVARDTFLAMSTTMAILGVGVSEQVVQQAAQLGRRLAADWERRFSRFRSESQLSRLNAADGRPVPVDNIFLDLIELASMAVRRTGGRFDPAILPALEAAGYDRSIERVWVRASTAAGGPRPAVGSSAWDLVRIDRDRGTVTLPKEMRIDLGGVAKGAFADRLATEFQHWPGGCVDAGGDLRLWGEPPAGEQWVIGIEDPFQSECDLLAVEVAAGTTAGIATSGTHRRRWQAAGQIAHHLIDPQRGIPVPETVRSVTALAPDAATADIAAKALLIAAAGGEDGDLYEARLAVIAYANEQIDVMSEDHAYAYSCPRIAPISLPT